MHSQRRRRYDIGLRSSGISDHLQENYTTRVRNRPNQYSKLDCLWKPTRSCRNHKGGPLRIKDAKIPIDLQVVDADEGSILLGIDWFNRYKVCLDVHNKTLTFESERQKFQTMIEYTLVA